MEFDNPENPSIIEDFIRAIGAEPVIYPYRNECCGGYISLKEKDMAKNMCDKIVDSAEGFGADMHYHRLSSVHVQSEQERCGRTSGILLYRTSGRSPWCEG